MKILMVGLGSIGQRHLRNIKRLFGDEHEIIAYRTRRLQQTFSDSMQVREGVDLEKEYGLRVYVNLDEALDEKPDVVFITNITSKHMEIAMACAKAGCNLFIEKPLSNSLVGIDELQRIIDEKKLIAFVGFQNRYHPCVKRAKKIIEDGTLGSIQSASFEFSERLTTMHMYEDYRQTYMAKAEMGGGPVLNLQIHDLDLLFFLFGEPLNVISYLSKNSQLEVNVEDGASSLYTFKNANDKVFPVYTHTDFLQFPPVHTFKIVGESGRIEVDLNKATLSHIQDGEKISEMTFPDFKRNDMFIEELKRFMDSLNGKKEPSISLSQGVVSLKMAIGAQQSSHDNMIVTLKEE